MLVADGNMFREMTIRLFCHCADIIHCVRISEFVEKLQLKVPYIAANKNFKPMPRILDYAFSMFLFLKVHLMHSFESFAPKYTSLLMLFSMSILKPLHVYAN